MKKKFTFTLLLMLCTILLSEGLKAEVKNDPHIRVKLESESLKVNPALKAVQENSYPLKQLYSYNYSEISTGLYGVFYWEGKVYASQRNRNDENPVGKIYRFTIEDNTLVPDGDLIIDNALGAYNFEAFCTDGEFIYGVNSSQRINKINPETWTVEDIIETQMTYDSYDLSIAYDPIKDGFWIGSQKDKYEATFYFRTGKKGATLSGATDNVMGLAIDVHSEGGPYLWAACGASGLGFWETYATLGRWNLNTGEFESDVYDIGADFPSGDLDQYMASIFVYEADGNLNMLGISAGVKTIFGYEMAPLADLCQKISNLKAEVNDDDVTLTWTAPMAKTPTGYEVSRDEVVIGTSTTTSYADIGVISGTRNYSVKAIYDDGESFPVSIQNVMVGDFCEAVITMYDSYDNRWNGDARMNIYRKNVMVGTAKLYMQESGAKTTLMLPSGNLDFVWVEGLYDNEVSFTIAFDGEEVYSGEDPKPGSFFKYICGAGFKPVTGLKITQDNDDCDYTISWDAPNGALSYNIYKDGNLIENTQQTSYTVNITDISQWCLKAVYENGLSEEECAANKKCTSGSVDLTLHTAEDIIISPNPASSIVTITGEVAEVEIYDYTGRRIYSDKGQINTVDVSGYMKGLYLVRISDINGKIAVRQLIVK